MIEVDPQLSEILKTTTQNFLKEKAVIAAKREREKEFQKKTFVTLRYGEAYDPFVKEQFDQIYSGILSSEDVFHLEQIKKTHSSDQIHSIILGPNASVNSLGGHILTLKEDTPITNPTLAININAPFATLMVTKIHNHTIAELSAKKLRKHFGPVLKELLTSLSANELPSLSKHYDATQHADKLPWPAFFPSTNAFAGVYHDREHIFIIVNTHAGNLIAADLCDTITSEQMTAKDLAHHKALPWITDLVHRNAQRITHLIANALQFTVRSYPDMFAVVPRFHDYPKLAKPDHYIKYNTIRYNPITKSVSFVHDLSDGRVSKSSHILVFSDAVHGIRGFLPTERGLKNQSGDVFPIQTSEQKKPIEHRNDTKNNIQKMVVSLSNQSPELQYQIRHHHKKTSYDWVSDSLGINLDLEDIIDFKPIIVVIN